LASIASMGSNVPSSPAQSAFSRDTGGENDAHMRTLDYLGLAETPQPTAAQLATTYIPTFVDFSKASRFRSYSVNNKDKYANEDDEEEYEGQAGALESQYVAHLQDQLAATNAAIHNHNLAVQAFANQAAVSRPRARTAGVLDAPGSRLLRNYYPTPSRLDNTINAAELQLAEEKEMLDLPQAVAAMSLSRSSSTRHATGLLTVDEQGLEGPTSALWLGSIPTSTTTSTLTEMFKSYGPILSARVLTHKSCGFVNFEKVDSAMAAKASLNGKEIFPGAGPVRINFAKPPSASNTPGHDGAYPSPSPDPFSKGYDKRRVSPTRVPTPGDTRQSAAIDAVPVVPPLADMVSDILDIVKEFEANEDDRYRISTSIQNAVKYTEYVDEIPPIKEPAQTRVYDAPKLRDIRKRIDNQTLSRLEIENIAMEMLPEIAELSSDYLGNTVVQKLFEHCSDEYRDAMLVQIAPHMAEIGVHKNGTWAAQKIIDVCKTPNQMSLIVEHLRPYIVPLFLDQYGNYVLQGCLKFGSPYNDFIFETMLSKMWDIAQGRYGARAMRACLESHHSTKDQQRMLAATIALHSVELATNQNGALLLTWFLDTCTFPHRRTVLSPRLVPYLVHLCTHKVAYMTVLKVINQKAEPEARDTILKAMFFSPNDRTLEAILSDHTSGATLIFKVLTTPFFDESIRAQVVENVKSVLVRIKAQPGQGYKRLMDEVGLSTRGGGGGGGGGNAVASASRDNNGNSPSDRPRPGSRQTGMNAQHGHPQQSHNNQAGLQHQQMPQREQLPHGQPGHFTNGQFYNPSSFDTSYSMPRSENVDSSLSQQFPAFNPQSSLFTSGQAGGIPQLTLQQLQYQQSLMNSRTPAINNYYNNMPAGFAGYSSPNPSIDQYRGQSMLNGSPNQSSGLGMPPTPQSAFGTPAFGANTMGLGVGGAAYGGIPSFPYAQEQPVNARRGRVRTLT
jgi:protein JSN1